MENKEEPFFLTLTTKDLSQAETKKDEKRIGS